MGYSAMYPYTHTITHHTVLQLADINYLTDHNMKSKSIAHIFLAIALFDAIAFSGISITRSLILSNSKVSNQTAAVLQKTTPSTLSSGAKVNMSRPDVQKAITALQANPTDKQQVLTVQNALVRNRMLTTNQVTGVFDDATKKAAAIYSKMTPLSSTKPASSITAKSSSDACKYVPRMEGTTFVPDPDYNYSPAYTQPLTIVGSQMDIDGVVSDPNYTVEQAGAGETTISAMDKGVTNSIVMQNAFDCHNDADDKLLYDWSKPTGYSSDSTVPPSQLRVINGVSTDRRITGSDGDRYLTGGELAMISYEINNSGYLCDSIGFANTPNFCAAISKFVDSNPSANWYHKNFSLYIDRSSYGGFAPSPYTVFDPTDARNMKTAEDAATNVIQTTNKMAVVAQNGLTAEIPATNCMHVAGKGPIKIVLMTGKSYTMAAASATVDWYKEVIILGFNATEPFKSLSDQFSFYIDLKKFDDVNAPTHLLTYKGLSFYTTRFGESVKAGSSCSTGSGSDGKGPFTASLYYFLSYRKDIYPGFAQMNGVVFINNGSIYGFKSVNVYVHEAGHAMGYLMDEYILDVEGSNYMRWLFSSAAVSRNCALFPKTAFKSTLDNQMYGSITAQGCGFTKMPSPPKVEDPHYWYRPSDNGLMNHQDEPGGEKFNVIDCGYIFASILDKDNSKKMAQKYWPKCLTMAKENGSIVMDGISPPNTAKPTAVPVSASSVAAGLPMAITGTNFTPDSNSVHLTNTTTQEEYDIDDLTSNGTLLNVIIPDTIPPGSYSLKIGAFNSDWSNSIPLTVTAAGAPVTTSAVITSFTSSNAYMIIGSNKTFTLSWTATNASSCWLSDTGSSKTLPIISTVTKGPISQNTTYTLTCSNSTVTPATTVSKSLTVSAVTEKSLRTDGGNN